MSKEKIIFSAAAAAVCTIGLTAAAVIICKRLFEKNYMTVSDSTNIVKYF